MSLVTRIWVSDSLDDICFDIVVAFGLSSSVLSVDGWLDCVQLHLVDCREGFGLLLLLINALLDSVAVDGLVLSLLVRLWLIHGLVD